MYLARTKGREALELLQKNKEKTHLCTSKMLGHNTDVTPTSSLLSSNVSSTCTHIQGWLTISGTGHIHMCE
jgi:hypothetical protein